MAPASQKKTTFLSHKLTFLKGQGHQLNSAVGLYVNGIIETGESWTEGNDNKMGFLELCQTIETATVFLLETYEQLAGNPLSLPSCDKSDLTSQSTTTTTTTTTTTASNSATSHSQPLGKKRSTLSTTKKRSATQGTSSTTRKKRKASPHNSTSTTSEGKHSEPVQPPDATQLKPVLARIAVIEKALSSFHTNADKVAEQQSGIDQQLKELLSKLSQSEKKHNSRLRKVKKQIGEISDTQVVVDHEQETRLQSLEEQLHKLSTAQDRMEVEMESQAELTEKLVHVPDQLESVKEKLDVLDARIGRIIDDCSNKHQDIDHVTRDLADKVMVITDTVQVISEGQDQKTTLLKELETRLQTLEADSERNVKDVQKQAEKGETNVGMAMKLGMLCQMLNDRLTPLEQLRTSLNQRASTRDENIKKLSQVIQEVAVMSPRLHQLEVKSSRTRCGFTAWTWLNGVTGSTVSPYTYLYCNVGGNFDRDSGTFTAPVDGLYVASVSLNLSGNETVEVGVKYNKQGQGQSSSTHVCWSSAQVNGTNACSVGVVDMKAGDTLFSYVIHNTSSLNKQVWFSCFLLT